ncbi:MAG: phosphate ABC transporter permease PstA [Spirochaeta sp.]|nr:phosphate ABC transporter permease PstA [Spirochaeta sp.]
MSTYQDEHISHRHEEIIRNIDRRRRSGKVWHVLFYIATTISILALVVLLLNIFNSVFGFVLIENEVAPEELIAGGNLEELSQDELIALLEENLSRGLIRRFNFEDPLEERSVIELSVLVQERIVNPTIIEAWSLRDSLFNQEMIRAVHAENPGTTLQFRSWLNPQFLLSAQNPRPQFAGIRTAFLGSLWMIVIVIAVSFPIGVAAAIYLEEYARSDKWYNRLIEVNVYNLAGIPSIIYGLLGLAVFVRALEPLTSGTIFGATDPTTANGRTILSAGLTLALLILPIIIINSREAIKAVPNSLRDSSYGLGATKWQTVWHHVLPASFDRILTGTILAVSRAIGETAPLVVVGASTFITVDPASFFSKFTTLPIQIYQWSARPQSEFRNIAAAAIIVLLVLMLTLNAMAIIMRNRISKKRRVS